MSMLAQIAREEYLRRRDGWLTAIRAGKRSQEEGEENMRLWLAIATEAQADLPELFITAIYPPDHKSRVLSHEIARPHEWRAELGRARDRALDAAALDMANVAKVKRARGLMELARALGPPPYFSRINSRHSERKAA